MYFLVLYCAHKQHVMSMLAACDMTQAASTCPLQPRAARHVHNQHADSTPATSSTPCLFRPKAIPRAGLHCTLAGLQAPSQPFCTHISDLRAASLCLLHWAVHPYTSCSDSRAVFGGGPSHAVSGCLARCHEPVSPRTLRHHVAATCRPAPSSR